MPLTIKYDKNKNNADQNRGFHIVVHKQLFLFAMMKKEHSSGTEQINNDFVIKNILPQTSNKYGSKRLQQKAAKKHIIFE